MDYQWWFSLKNSLQNKPRIGYTLDMPKCPKCKEELSKEEVFSLVQSVRGSMMSDKKLKAVKANILKAVSSGRNGKRNSGMPPEDSAQE